MEMDQDLPSAKRQRIGNGDSFAAASGESALFACTLPPVAASRNYDWKYWQSTWLIDFGREEERKKEEKAYVLPMRDDLLISRINCHYLLIKY